MKPFSALWFALRSLRRRADDELDEELAYHLERETTLHEQRGLSQADARREALRQFGGVQRYREETRDVRRTSWIADVRADARFALRLVRHQPGFTANVVLISALGIAACATTFSLVSGILLSPLPFSSPDRVASLQLTSVEGRVTSAAIPIDSYLRIAAGSPVIEAIAAARSSTAATDGDGAPEIIRVRLITASYFRVFGIAPVLGRAFSEAEAQDRTPVVVLGHAAWRARYRGDSAVLGRRIALNGVPHTVIGVMPPRFRGNVPVDPPLWAPMVVTSGGPGTVAAIVRVARGVTPRQAEAWLATVVAAKVPTFSRRDSVPAMPELIPIASLIYGSAERPLFVLLGAVILVLVLVGANVATLLLARSAARQQELDVRRALGASAGRQLRQLVTESVTLTAIGGVLGIAVSYWLVGLIRGLGTGVLPRMEDVALDWRVLLFAVGGTMLTGVIGGLAPALAGRREIVNPASGRSGARVTANRTSSVLVVAQIALSVVLVVGAGLLVKGFLRVVPTNPGFALENRATVFVGLRPEHGFRREDPDAARQFIQAATERMRLVNGVRDVASTSFLPFTDVVSVSVVEIPGRPTGDEELRAFRNSISPNFFSVMRISVVRGRSFTAADRAGTDRVVIVNQTAASRWWPDANPVGRQLTFSDGPDRYTATVVGVSSDTRLDGQDTEIRPEMYTPVAQSIPRAVSFVAVTSVDPKSIIPALKRAVQAAAPQLPITEASDLATMASESVSEARFFSVAMALFAISAIALSALGVYGLLSFAVAQRRQEIGIRIALGAPAARIGRLVLERAVMLGAAGVVIGLILARAFTRYMESLLHEVGAGDGGVFAIAGVAVLAVAMIAACAPAYRALRVDPLTSLRA